MTPSRARVAAVVAVLTALHITPAHAQTIGPVPDVKEAAGASAVVTITRPAGQGAETVSFTARRRFGFTPGLGMAIEGSDFQPVTGQATFAPGDTSASFTVPILDDLRAEGPEVFGVALVRGSAFSSATNVKILDDEAAVPPVPPTISARPIQRVSRGAVRFTTTTAIDAYRLQLSGSVTVKALHKSWRFGSQSIPNVRGQIAQGFALSIPATAQTRLEQAADDGRRISAVIKVVAMDHVRRKAISALRVRLR
jgi:Calx-beta domain